MRRLQMLTIPVLVFSLALSQLGCGVDAKTVVSALTKAIAIADLPHAQAAIDLGNQLVADLQAGGTNAPTILPQLITAWDAVIADAGQLTGVKRTLVMLALLAGDYALHKLANKYQQRVASGRLSANPKVAMFSRRPVWRCRSSQSGQYKPMSYCKAHPDVSTVETQ